MEEYTLDAVDESDLYLTIDASLSGVRNNIITAGADQRQQDNDDQEQLHQGYAWLSAADQTRSEQNWLLIYGGLLTPAARNPSVNISPGTRTKRYRGGDASPSRPITSLI